MEHPGYKIAWNHSKNQLNCFKYNTFCFHKFSKSFCEYIRMEKLDYKNENIDRKYLEKIWINQFLKVKNNLLELEKDFKELKDRELKDIEEKIKREIEKLFHQLIFMSKNCLDKFEELEMKKIRPIITNWFDWLIKQNVMGNQK